MNYKYISKQWSSYEGRTDKSNNDYNIKPSKVSSQSTHRLSTSNVNPISLVRYDNNTKLNNLNYYPYYPINNNYTGYYQIAKLMNYNNSRRSSRTYDNTINTGIPSSQSPSRLYNTTTNNNIDYFYNNNSDITSSYYYNKNTNFYYPHNQHSGAAVGNNLTTELSITDFVYQRYGPRQSPSPNRNTSIQSTITKQRSCESPIYSPNNLTTTTTNNNYIQRHSANIYRQKSCEIPSNFVDYPPQHSGSSRKQSFGANDGTPYGNTEVTIGIEQLSMESSSSNDYENFPTPLEQRKSSSCNPTHFTSLVNNQPRHDYLSVNRYAGNVLSKQKSCESPPLNDDEFSYAQKYKLKNLRQKSCESPTALDDDDDDENELPIQAVRKTSMNPMPSKTYRQQSISKLYRQPSIDVRDNNEPAVPVRKSSYRLSHQQQQQHKLIQSHLSPTFCEQSSNNFHFNTSRSPITKQRSCEIEIYKTGGVSCNNSSFESNNYESINKIDNVSSSYPNNNYNDASHHSTRRHASASSSSGNFNKDVQQYSSSANISRSSISGSRGGTSNSHNTTRRGSELNQGLRKECSRSANPIVDCSTTNSSSTTNVAIVSVSSTDLRYLRRNTTISSTNTNTTTTTNSSQPISTSSNARGVLPLLSNESSPRKTNSNRSIVNSTPRPSNASTKLTKRFHSEHRDSCSGARKYSTDSHDDVQRNDKSIWSQAMGTLKKKREVFFGKRSKTRSTEKNLVDPVYHFLKCTANIDHNPPLCECPCHTLPNPEIIPHAHSTVNLPAIPYKSKHKS